MRVSYEKCLKKASYTPIYTPFENFEKACHSKETKITYSYHLSGFLKFCKFEKYDQLLEISDKERFDAIKEYLNHRKESGVSYSDMNLTMSAIRLFFDMNGVDISKWRQLSRIKGKPRRVVDNQIYTDEELRLMLDHADRTEKVAVLILLTTGMRVGALAGLRIGDTKYIEEYSLYKFIPYSEDINEKYVTYCTPECATAISRYLKHRTEKEGETLTKDSPFMTHKTNNPERIKHDGFYTAKSLGKMLERLRYDANLETRTTSKNENRSESGRIRKQRARAHVFRTIFNTRCVQNNVNHTVKEYFMGHKSGMGLDKNYFRGNDDNKLLSEYMKVVDALTINEENRLQLENIELKKDREEINLLKQKLDELTKEHKKTKGELEALWERDELHEIEVYKEAVKQATKPISYKKYKELESKKLEREERKLNRRKIKFFRSEKNRID